MSEDLMGSADALVIGDGKTSDQLLEEINAVKSKGTDTTSEKSPDVSLDSAPTVEDAPEPQSGKQPQTEEVSESSEVEPVPQGEPTRSEGKAVDVNEWMKKKGFRSVEDMAKSLRSLEQELSRRGGKTLDETRPMAPDPVITTQSRYIQPQNSVEELAKRYNLPPEDFERVMPLINDATDLKMRMGITPLISKIQQLESQLRKKAADEELDRDPTFKNRVVLKEMYQIMESDPSVQNAPDPRKAAHEKALQNLGRRAVEGLEGAEFNQETRSDVPTTPPPMGKSGQGTPRGSHMKTIMGKMTPEKFNSLSSAEMEKYLSQQGKVKNETF